MGTCGKWPFVMAQRRRRSKDIGIVPTEVQQDLQKRFEAQASFSGGSVTCEDAKNLLSSTVSSKFNKEISEEKTNELLAAVESPEEGRIPLDTFMLLYATLMEPTGSP